MSDITLDELQRRVQQLEDMEAIKKLKARYLNACDSKDPEGAKNCFAEGEVFIDMGHVGVFRTREEFAALYKAAGCLPFILDMHHGANAEIEFTGSDHARALWALEYRNFNLRDKTVTFVSLIYHDEYARIGGYWKITRSVSEFKTALHCSYESGKLAARIADKSVAGAVSYSAS